MADGRTTGDALKTDPWMRQRQQQVAGKDAPGTRTASYFGYQPELSAQEEQELRRQQLQTHRRVEAIDKQNQWMLIPVFAPEMAIAGAELTGAFVGRALAKRVANMKPLEWGPQPARGENLWTIRGKRAHKAFREKVEAKPAWKAEEA